MHVCISSFFSIFIFITTMKFAKELDEQAIPEWKNEYFNYKQAKKKLKAVAKATRSVPPSARPKTTPANSLLDAPVTTLLRRKKPSLASALSQQPPLSHVRSKSDSQSGLKPGNTIDFAHGAVDERSPLHTGDQGHHGRPGAKARMASYGSIIGSPPDDADRKRKQHDAPSLELPAPAVAVEDGADDGPPLSPKTSPLLPDKPGEAALPAAQLSTSYSSESNTPLPPATQMGHIGNAYEIRPATDQPQPPGGASSRLRDLFPQRTNSIPDSRPFMKRVFSVAGNTTPKKARDDHDVALEAYKELDFRQADFFLFLDRELAKIENFYRTKEDEAKERLEALREQLHIMREYRLAEIQAKEERHKHAHETSRGSANTPKMNGQNGKVSSEAERLALPSALKRPFRKSVDETAKVIDKFRPNRVGKTSIARENLGSPNLPGSHWVPDNEQRDYARKRAKEVPYRTAKRKMKSAMAEFYRLLELLKSYALVNRTAFRKINKKYDKTVDAHPKLQYTLEKVNSAHFVASEEVEHLMAAVEDLYARYFEKGNRKVAVSKLRTKTAKAGDFTGPVARTCALLAAGSVFGVQGLVKGAELLFTAPEPKHVHVAYLLQLYAGYFMMVLLAFLFVGCAGFFNEFRVNYQFIFELDNRQALNWLQMSEIPAWLYFILGVTIWLNFDLQAGGDTMFLYWIVVLIGLSVIALFLPFPVLYHKARIWFLYTLWRLLCSGLYGVEFRDFFMGDMFCSLTYSIGNIELFFCLFAGNWNTPTVCNSSNSRLLGFLTTLPGIWRAFQCIRRYRDTHQVFPHLVNCAKYGFTILQYMTLSLYRLDQNNGMRALFITMATLNGIYCSIWDIFMDWSLGDLYAPKKFLRPTLAYRKKAWIYYAAMVIDPILRFNWIFYAIYTSDAQHSSIVSFLVGFTEVLRRGMWTLFRVENEHCTNIERQKASRDIPLPYKIMEQDSTSRLITTPQSEGEEDTDKTVRRDHATAPFSPVVVPTTLEEAETGPDPYANKDFGRSKNKSKQQQDIPTLAERQAQLDGQSEPKPKPTTPRSLRDVFKGSSSARDGSALERQQSSNSGTLRFRRTGGSSSEQQMAGSPITHALQRVGTTIRAAHAFDYERKKKPEEMGTHADSDDDDDDDDESDREP
ncbi:hypothetical protein AC578_3485 [Pseudocercospora eumusae]|uniref:SPX domain-containing protein n=1 Tax=Pseudocercospora eumusae TaxID=321146 RepID=A0A139HQX1_9PEZI|nr:hypothetical protein AC578_3485 [Pseudocercospora eumusae]